MSNITYIEDIKTRRENARALIDAKEILGEDFDKWCAWTLEHKHELRELFGQYLDEREANISAGKMEKVSPVAKCYTDIQVDAYLEGWCE